MIQLGPWREVERPADTPAVAGCWRAAAIAAEQDPRAARVLWDGDEPLAVGGVVELTKGEGLAFAWAKPGLSPMTWRRILPALAVGIQSAHERGMRRVIAVVAAGYAEGIRLLKRLRFEFVGIEIGWPDAGGPMLRYQHALPAFEPLPALVAHQLRETELACFGAWCPAMMEAPRG